MRTLRKGFPESERVQFVNGTGAAIVVDDVVDLGSRGWGVAVNPVAIGATGVVSRLGRFRMPKVAATAFVAGQEVGWDSTNKEVVVATSGRPIGVLTEAAASGDTHAILDLNQQSEMYEDQVVGDASGGLQVNLGFSAVPGGAVIVISTTNVGVTRVQTSVTLDTGGNAGKITITTTVGAASDIHHIIAFRN